MMNVVSRAVATDLPRKARPLLVISGVEKVYSNGMQALAGVDLTLPGRDRPKGKRSVGGSAVQSA